jgi:hypothetical protein
MKELVSLIGRIRRLGGGVAADNEKSVESVLRRQFNDVVVAGQCGAVWRGRSGSQELSRGADLLRDDILLYSVY